MRTDSKPQRRPYAKTASTRRRILDASIGEFAEHGFARASTIRIAEVACASETVVFYHFETKSRLLIATLEERDRRAMERSTPLPQDASLIPAAMITVAEREAESPVLGVLNVVVSAEAIALEHPAHEHFQLRQRQQRERFIAVFELLESAGLLASGVDVAFAAESTHALWDGLQVQRTLDQVGVDLPALLERHLRLITTVRPEAANAPNRENAGMPTSNGPPMRQSRAG